MYEPLSVITLNVCKALQCIHEMFLETMLLIFQFQKCLGFCNIDKALGVNMAMRTASRLRMFTKSVFECINIEKDCLEKKSN